MSNAPARTLLDEPPPHDLLAEMSLLGALILEPEHIPEIAAAIGDGEAFFRPVHNVIFRALVSSFEQAGRTNLVLLGSSLADSKDMAEAGGIPYLEKLATETPGPATIATFTKIVAEKHQRRLLLEAATRLAQDALNTTHISVGDIAGRAMERVTAATAAAKQVRRVSMKEAVARVISKIGDTEAEAGCYTTGIQSLDENFGGLVRGDVTTFMGSPSSGKTTGMLQVVSGVCALNAVHAAIFSNEQSPERIAATILTQHAAVSIHDAMNRKKLPTSGEWSKITRARSVVEEFGIELVDEPMHAGQIFNTCRLLARQGVGIAVIDYIQDLPPIPGYTMGEERIGESVRQLKRISRELGMTTIMVSQVDKQSGKENRRPTKFDGLYSSKIEQASAVMIGIWRPNMGEPAPAGDPGEYGGAHDSWKARSEQADWLWLKNKYGPLGELQMRFSGRDMCFRDA